jgi:hypothetical protein
MPAPSKAMRKAAAIAEHHPEKLHKKNRGMLKMSKKQLHEFASTPEKGLPKKKTKIKGKVHGSGVFGEADVTQGFKRIETITQPVDPDIKPNVGMDPEDPVAVAKEGEAKSTGTPIEQAALEVPGFETSQTIQKDAAL